MAQKNSNLHRKVLKNNKVGNLQRGVDSTCTVESCTVHLWQLTMACLDIRTYCVFRPPPTISVFLLLSARLRQADRTKTAPVPRAAITEQCSRLAFSSKQEAHHSIGLIQSKLKLFKVFYNRNYIHVARLSMFVPTVKSPVESNIN